MIETLPPVIATLSIIILGAALGMAPVRKLIEMYEAKHELKQGSASMFRRLSGWFFIVIWLAVIWFLSTITGDWWITGDWEGALARSGKRLEIILHILAALGDD